jgi:hypothetical protein
MKLLPDGRCGIFVKRKTAEDEPKTPQMIAANKARKKLDRLGL